LADQSLDGTDLAFGWLAVLARYSPSRSRRRSTSVHRWAIQDPAGSSAQPLDHDPLALGLPAPGTPGSGPSLG